MALSSVVGTGLFRERLRAFWAAFSATTAGDLVATAIAITAMSAIFLAASFAILGLSRAVHSVLRFLGAG